MAIIRKSLKKPRRRSREVDWAKVEATTEEDIRRHMIEDGENPDREPRIEDVFTPHHPQASEHDAGAIRTRLAIPVATLRNWEQGRNSIDPAARSLLIVVARDPQAATRGSCSGCCVTFVGLV